jgi:acyl transferase domain-containing protein
VLLRDIGETLEKVGVRHVAVGSVRRDRPVMSTLHGSLADLYQAGLDIRWESVLAPPRRHVSLPAYPWQRRRHWLDGTTGPQPHGDGDVIAVAPPAEQVVDLARYVRERVAAAAGLAVEDVAEDLPLELLGLSSLSVVELRNQIERELGIVVPLAALLGGGTPEDLAAAIVEAVESTDAAEPVRTAEATLAAAGSRQDRA